MSRLNKGIAALQDPRLAESNTLRENDYSFFWEGRAEGEVRLNGVGFTLKNSLLSAIKPPSDGTERILALRLSTSTGFVNILSIYAPTLCSAREDKDQFYEDPDAAVAKVLDSVHLFLLGDFNTRVGGEHDS